MDTPRPVRFVLVGAYNALVGWTVLLAFTAIAERLGGSWREAIIPAQLVAATSGFFAHHHFVFPDAKADGWAFLRYNATTAGVLVLLSIELYALVDVGGMRSAVAQTAVLPFNVAILYVLHRFVSFRPA